MLQERGFTLTMLYELISIFIILLLSFQNVTALTRRKFCMQTLYALVISFLTYILFYKFNKYLKILTLIYSYTYTQQTVLEQKILGSKYSAIYWDADILKLRRCHSRGVRGAASLMLCVDVP